MNKKLFSLCVLAMWLWGCALPQRSDPELPSSDSLRRAAVEMVEQVLTDPRLEMSYKEASVEAMKRGHKLPALLVRRPKTRDDSIPTGQMFRQLQTAFGRTMKFAIVDYTAINLKDDYNEPDIGIEPGGTDAIGEYTGKDFLADSQIICEGRTWFLNMQIFNSRKNLVLTGNVEIRK